MRSVYSILFVNEDELELKNEDERYFFRALLNGRFAMGLSHPNPSVGAVIVKQGRVLGEGHTQAVGFMHAERHAIANAREDLAGATLYATLEPCCHFGRTPPCTQAIIDAQIKRVVYGVVDPYSKVAGGGIEALKRAGIEVEKIRHEGLMELAEAILSPFALSLKAKKPYVVMKVAVSKDSYFARHFNQRTAITGARVQERVHALRRASDMIMVGANTLRVDDPDLRPRLGEPLHANEPTIAVLSSDLELPRSARIFKREGPPVIIFSSKDQELDFGSHVHIEPVPLSNHLLDLQAVFKRCLDLGYNLVLIEAGPILCEHLLASSLLDEVWLFRSKENFGTNGPHVTALEQKIETKMPCINREILDDDELRIFKKYS